MIARRFFAGIACVRSINAYGILIQIQTIHQSQHHARKREVLLQALVGYVVEGFAPGFPNLVEVIRLQRGDGAVDKAVWFAIP